MNRRKIILLLTLVIIFLCAVSIGIIENIMDANPDYRCITYEEAAVMLAALDEGGSEITYSSGTEYMDMLVSRGILRKAGITEYVDNAGLSGIISYYDIDGEYIKSLKLRLYRSKRKVSREAFYDIYDYILSKRNKEDIIKKELVIAATPGNMDTVEAWHAYTDDGQYTFYGLALDGYMDKRISAYVCDRRIIGVIEVLSDEVTYPNVWIYSGDSGNIHAYVEGIERDFYPDSLTEHIENVMADICVDNGILKEVNIKTDTIKGRVLSITDEYVEIEGYGIVPFDVRYKIYKNYDGFCETDYSKILVGYELQEFIVADGKICGAVIMYPFEVNNIRVLIRDTGFKNIYHENARIGCTGDYYVMSGDAMSERTLYKKNDMIILDKESAILSTGRIRIEPVAEADRICIYSIERSQGNPAYPGYIEVASDENGIFIINEVNLEQYLKLVVPSEMPAGYGKEAAKVQAVCARSYAYNQLQNNDYKEYGAHIDDSTWYQVYNNTNEYKASSDGVDETCGQVMTSGNEVITAYYYSTSHGHGSTTKIWGTAQEECPYITAHTINPDNTYIDLTSNSAFYNYITGVREDDFDSSFPLYRWKTTLTLNDINKLYKDKAQIGEIKSIEVTERLEGGSVNKVIVKGSMGEYTIEGEMAARRFFGDSSIEWINNRGKTFSMGSLPSGFFALNPIYKKNVLSGYEIIGGGYGHGLGMSQNGAYAMTKKGYRYDDILRFFYSGIEISKIY